MLPRWLLRMATLGSSLQKTWVNWNVEATPAIYLAITLLGALILTPLAFAFSVLAYYGLGQVPEAPLRPSLASLIFLPPLAVLAAWLVYRYRRYRIMFWGPKQA